MTDVIRSGILTTASDLLFTGDPVGLLPGAGRTQRASCCGRSSLGSQILNGPMTYEVDGRQYVAVISGHALSTFALRE